MASKTSRRWLKEHFSDSYVKKAQKTGYRSRAAYKLLEIQKRDRLFRPGMTVIDLGAAPGGVSQVLSMLVGRQGRTIAVDRLPMAPIDGVDFIQGDISDGDIFQILLARVGQAKADWVVSDMAPNLSGNETIDVPRSIQLARLVMGFSLSLLRTEGGLLVKVFQGEGLECLLDDFKKAFAVVSIRKPPASRQRSRELYLVAKRPIK